MLSHLARGVISSQRAPWWDLVDVLCRRNLIYALLTLLLWALERGRHLVDPLSPRARLRLIGRALGRGLGSCAGGRRLGLKHGPDQQLQTVPRGDALAAVQGAEPPALEAPGVLLYDGQDVPFTEGQLLWGLRHVVVQRFGHQVLQKVEQTFFKVVCFILTETEMCFNSLRYISLLLLKKL